MAHFALLCPEDAGHMLSNGPVGKELFRRGHRVTILGRARAAPLAEQLDLPLHQLNTEKIIGTSSLFLDLLFHNCGLGEQIDMRDWFSWQAEVVLELIPPALKELEVDGLIVDHIVAAGGTAAELAGVPFVTISSALLWNEDRGVPPSFSSWPYSHGRLAELRNRLGYAAWHWFKRPTLNVINRYRDRAKLPRFGQIGDTISPFAQISQLCPGFDFPRHELPDTFHYVGSLTTDRRESSDYQFPWDRLDGRPLIFASLGTVPDPANLPVFRHILAACAGLDAQLVLALGKWNDEGDPVRERLGTIPDNALVVDFAPQLKLLERAALLITHAGVNTVLESLCRAVPIVALPRSADQPAMGSRVAHSGAGLLGSFRKSTPEQIRGLIQRVLAEDTFRRRTQELQAEMLAAGGLSRAADIAEEALTTGQPVLRPFQKAISPCETELAAL